MATEAEALAGILAWSTDSPAWQRDALRRLATQQSIEPVEIDELAAICKGVQPGVPLEAGHFRDVKQDQGDVYLRGISAVSHVSALATGQRLSIRKDGLTVVYGDNGSGKSGYARILKKACRARNVEKVEEVIPDIYEQNPGIPSATIEYAIGGQNRSCAWQLGTPADAALSDVSVFDSRTANVHVDDTNDVAYTPMPLKMLAQLAGLCKPVKDKLVADVTRLKEQTPVGLTNPTCSPETTVGKLVAALSGTTAPDRIETLSTLSQEERDRHAQLTADLADDPQRVARQLGALKTKVEGHIQQLDRLFASVTDQEVARIDQLVRDAETARQAANAASAALFRDEPIPQIGTEAWHLLWDSARAFSEQDAYPERIFPVTENGVCVLCQQDLSHAASHRLKRFDEFVRDNSQLRAEQARQRLTAAMEKFQGAGLSIREIRNITATIRDELKQAGLASEVKKATVQAAWRHRQILGHLQHGAAVTAASNTYNRQGITDCLAVLDGRVAGLLADAGSAERLALLSEKAELADRQWLAGVKADVLAEIERRKQIAALETAQKQTSTARITTKSTEVAGALVTDALRAQFTIEVGSFKITDLALELRQQNSREGMPRFKVALIRKPDAKVAQVLSEGEHRCTALAAFLAELSTTESKSGIVFDDPVSSLDHIHREAVAQRLVAEAANRQVVVFTHDLAFLFELEQAARDASFNGMTVNSVARGRDKAGFTHPNPPFKARKVEQIVASLSSQLANERRHHDEGNEDEWRKTLKSILGTLRDSWEIAVEQAVSSVIRRLSNKVDTKNLVKLTVITAADCEAMRDGYGRCSEMLHSEAADRNRPLPRPEAIEQEITALEQWTSNLKARQDQARL
ncbi:AAA family ATPase [Brevundimonas sp. PAMC22021]|uniref:AAA family ATPase n=1 Tax=Brevundimonas sp. PAMC22021 TaxID=2861285 RepID=UPI001C636B45|nr:AAA family ATPase [Brevundimonas sp. PAMC22021]QYF86953.1 AAA family ATPase [Brevundimonas sp. PAMC22021]